MTARPVLISVDWGTTMLRAYLVDRAARVLEREQRACGVLAVEGGDYAGTLATAIGKWGSLPVIASGMIGSRNGWIETPYVRAPAALDDVARGLVAIGGRVHVVPGVDALGANGYEVMRGEETQIFGAMALSGLDEGTFVLPGTHSKWVRVRAGRIERVVTYLTGELYAVLKRHSILGRLMHAGEYSDQGFRRGIEAAQSIANAGELLARLFTVRTHGLAGTLPPEALDEYLSGLLIGSELADACASAETTPLLVGDVLLVRRYARAFELLERSVRTVAEDCVVAGHLAIARRAGLV